MKKHILLVLSFILTTGLMAQSHKGGTLSFQAGYKGGIQATKSIVKQSGTQLADYEENAMSSTFTVHAHYNLAKFLSAGVFMDYGMLTTDSTTADDTNPFVNFGVEARVYVLNFDNFNLYAGAAAGFSSLAMKSKIGSADYHESFTSPMYDFHAGINWYPLNIIGVHAQMGLGMKNYEVNEITVDNVAQNLDGFEYQKEMLGFEYQVGLSLKIN